MEAIKKSYPRTGLEVAVIGMAGRFPGASTIDEFWNNIKNGIESVSFTSEEELTQFREETGLLNNPNFVNSKGGVLEDKEFFDAYFFGYTPKEAEIMHPQLRIFHECAWEALENAGYDPDSYHGLIGLFAGAGSSVYWEGMGILSGENTGLGSMAARFLSDKDHISTKIAHKLNLKGASFILSTACSTGLVAIHLACRALLSGECDMVLAGGVSVRVLESVGYIYEEGMIMSPDGRCRAFDAQAGGTIGGEGIGIVALKLLEDALEDGDCIHALIKASAVNNDGNRKVGYEAPSVDGQAEVIRTAHRLAEVEPASITYVEAHGTGTILGDPIEIAGLKLAFNTNKKGFCGIGSVKTNIGHLDAAAAIAGFIKTVMALKHKIIPPSLHYETPNPGIDLIDSPFYVNTRAAEWKDDKFPLRAGVSSFGIGGTNVHVILEEAPVETRDKEGTKGLAPLFNAETSPGYQLILLSAKTESALERITQNLADYLKKNPGINLADAAYTLQVGRKAFEHRWMAVSSTVEEAIEVLASPGAGETHRVSPEEEGVDLEKPGAAVDKDSLLKIGRLWLHGHNIEWKGLYSQDHRCRISLPTYPFERQSYRSEGNLFKMGAEMLTDVSKTGKKPDIADWFYLPSWKRSVLLCPGHKKNSIKTGSYWLVFEDPCGLGSQLVKRLKGKGQEVIIVKPGSAFGRVSDQVYTLNPGKNTDYETLFKELHTINKIPENIVHIWSVTRENSKEPDLKSVEKDLDSGFYSLIYLAQAIGKHDFDNHFHITAISNNMQNVTGEEKLCPGKAALTGAVKVIPQEYTNINCSSIDLVSPKSGNWNDEHLQEQLMLEFQVENPEKEVAFRANYRWLPTFEPIKLEKGENLQTRLRERGIYLITGGLGGIGLELAKHLAESVHARLILTGRSTFPVKEEWDQWLETHEKEDKVSKKIKKLQELEKIGARILICKADVANLEEMQEVITRAGQQFGRINGVIHSAGLPDGCVIPLRTREITDSILSPKVTGTLVLDSVLKDFPLDFFVICSSLSSVLAVFGQVGYCAANAFQDAFAYQKTSRDSIFTTAINWDTWKEVGMGVDTVAQLAENENIRGAQQVMLRNAMLNTEAIDVFSRVLENPMPQIIVSTSDLMNRIDVQNRVEISTAAHEFEVETFQGTLYPRPELSTEYVAPHTQFEKTFANILKKFFGYDQVGIHDNFFEFGVTSLTIIRINSLLRDELKKIIPIVLMFEYPTIASLGQYLEQEEKGEALIHSEIEAEELEKEEALLYESIGLLGEDG